MNNNNNINYNPNGKLYQHPNAPHENINLNNVSILYLLFLL